jgi:hypothetical protein
MSAKTEELEGMLNRAHAEAEVAEALGNDLAAYEWRQEAASLAKELTEERIDRPFTNYEDLYGDYPI